MRDCLRQWMTGMLWVLTVVCTVLPCEAQNILVKGSVMDTSGNPVVGATVVESGKTTNGTITDLAGSFTLSVPQGKSIEISYVGMVSQTVKVTPGKEVRVTLQDASQSLDEVVVLAYGSSQKKDLTGSVVSVNAEELKSLPTMSIDDALAGKAAGLQVTKADGSPGGGVRMRIRGGASLSGNSDPLYIIDGIPTEVNNSYIEAAEIQNPLEYYGDDDDNTVGGGYTRGLNSLAGLNINDIETITVLKDASATALYGSKAANGVVIINTKRGRRNQKPQFSLSAYATYSTPIKEKNMNASQYKKALLTAAQNSIENFTYNVENMTGDRLYETYYLSYYASTYSAQCQAILDNTALTTEGGTDTDWTDLVTRTGETYNVDLSVSGGGESSRYYSSISYTKQNGTIINTDFERISGKVSVDTDFTKFLHSSININYGYTKNNITSGVYTQALMVPPIYEPYDEDGDYNTFTDTELGDTYATQNIQNPLLLAKTKNEAKTYAFKGTYGLEFDILKGLKYKTTASIDYQQYRQSNFIPSYINAYNDDYEGIAVGTEASSTTIKTFFENVLTYNHVFNENHRLDALLGTSWEQQKVNYFATTASGYPDDEVMTNIGSAQKANTVSGADPSSQNSLLSFYARINYVWKDRYLFTVTGRSDASSKFSNDHRVGYFPSAAVAWRVSQEDFMKGLTWIDELKIRASIGKTGNQSIGDNMYRTLYAVSSYADASAFYPYQLGNADIKWESTVQKDLGIDFSLFNGRLGGTLGYYYKVTKDALIDVSLAPSTGYTSVVTNVANVRNLGYEIELYGDFVRTKNFTWSAALNLAHNKSKVLKINSGDSDMFSDPTNRAELNLGTSVLKEGESLGLLCGYKSVTIKTEEELSNYKDIFLGGYGFYTLLCPAIGIGCKVNELDDDDYEGYYTYNEDVIGNCTPKFYGGFTNTLRYKNWSLMAHFTFSYGNDIMYMRDVQGAGMNDYMNRTPLVLDGYTSENQNFSRGASLFKGMMYMRTDQCIYDGSYLKLKSLNITYTLPDKWVKKVYLSGVQLYATATNVFTITSYPGADPEVSDDPTSIIGGGRDVSSYPTARSFTFGLRLNF